MNEKYENIKNKATIALCILGILFASMLIMACFSDLSESKKVIKEYSETYKGTVLSYQVNKEGWLCDGYLYEIKMDNNEIQNIKSEYKYKPGEVLDIEKTYIEYLKSDKLIKIRDTNKIEYSILNDKINNN